MTATRTPIVLIPGLPFNRAQVIMAEEDSVCNVSAAKRDFDFEPMSMEAALQGTR